MSHADRQLRELIRIVVRNLGLLEKTVSCCGITLAQCQAMVEIGREKSISLTELANLLRLDKSTMSRTINNLVESGLVLREQDLFNRRYVTIQLTQAGSELYHEIEDSMSVYYRDILSEIDGDKRLQVENSLDLLLEAAKKTRCCNPNTLPDQLEAGYLPKWKESRE